VLNESLHRPRYWQTFGAQGVADIFNEVAAAVQAGGASAKLFLNEYNLLQFSADPASKAPDPYANWYRWHAEELARAGAKLDGLGVQYYADGRGEPELGDNVHSAARIFEVLQNLSGTGLGLTLTEFTVNGREGVTAERGADILEETLRLVFGTPAAHSASGTCAPAHGARRPTARPSASSAPCSAAGPTARSTAATENAPRPLTAGYSPTTITADTDPSADDHPSAD